MDNEKLRTLKFSSIFNFFFSVKYFHSKEILLQQLIQHMIESAVLAESGLLGKNSKKARKTSKALNRFSHYSQSTCIRTVKTNVQIYFSQP